VRKTPIRFNVKATETAPHLPSICYLWHMEKRMIQLESLAALQDETIEKLSEEIYRQQQDLFQLKRRLQALEEKLATVKDSEQIGGNEKPPHY